VPEVEGLERRWMPTATRPLPGFASNTLAPNDDGSTGAVPLGFQINFFGVGTDNVFVNNNGNITIGQPLATFTPFDLTGPLGFPIIAPFFADVDTRGAGSPVTYGQDILCGHRAFGVDYFNVNYFDATAAGHVNLFNTFQVILISRPDTGPGNFDIEFNYDTITWETGDASGGTNGLGGQSAVVGYSNGTGAPGSFFELPGSGVNGALLDGGPEALNSHSLLATTPGRYHFLVRNGQVLQQITTNVDVTGATHLFFPFRYVFDPTTNTYRGNLTLLNVGGRLTATGADACEDLVPNGGVAAATFSSPVTVVFHGLPPGVQVLNPTGFTFSGNPFILENVSSFARNRPVRIRMVLSNPLSVPLGTFNESPDFQIEVFAGQFDRLAL
jgi:hypothetical protein